MQEFHLEHKKYIIFFLHIHDVSDNCLTFSFPHPQRCLLVLAPAELEGPLLSHSSIPDVTVIGVPDINMARKGLPRAYVVVDQGRITPGAIKSFVKDNLASHKRLRGGVIFVSEIPRVRLARSFEGNCARWLRWK